MIFEGEVMGFIPTQDAEAARRFYEGVLGMTFVSDDGYALVMDAGGTAVRIQRVVTFASQRFTVLGWEVRDLSGVVRALAKAGVELERYGLPEQDEDGIWAAPDGARVAWFKDPDENVLSISEHG